MNELAYKATRFLSRGVSRSVLPPLDGSIISFSFDDCPKSAIENALPLLETEGWRSTIYVACGLCNSFNHLGRHMSLSDIVDVYDRGHEIGDHTYSHLSSNNVSTQDYLADVKRNQAALKELGLPPSRHFAYPFGHVTPSLKQALGKHFLTMRGVLTPNNASQDSKLLNAVRVYSGFRVQDALKQIENAKTAPIWLNLFTHDVRETPSEFGCTPEEFEMIIAAVKLSGLPVMTVDKAYQKLQKTRRVA